MGTPRTTAKPFTWNTLCDEVLQELNLYGIQTTDAGLEHFKWLNNLLGLYPCWHQDRRRRAGTPKGAAEL